MSNDRLTELEIRVAFQEDLLETLNKIVAEQQQAVHVLQQQLRIVYQRLQDVQYQAQASTSPVDEIPPHY